MIIDAEGAILGRLASRVAKMILSGEEVIIVNAEKVVISGQPKSICDEYHDRRARGSAHHGPFYPRYADRMLWRTIRGMIPYKKAKGRDALKRLKIYVGKPDRYKDAQKIVKTKDKLRCKSITLNDISKYLGAKVG